MADIVLATLNDASALADIFVEHIEAHSEYISHGELQMGVAMIKVLPEGGFVTVPSPRARQMWLSYINEMLTSSEAVVYKAVEGDEIVGFCVADVEEDGAEPFGMVCDVLVKEGMRSQGLGSKLLQMALDWFSSKGIIDIYLESGKNNDPAHRFFQKRGFAKTSEIYKLI